MDGMGNEQDPGSQSRRPLTDEEAANDSGGDRPRQDNVGDESPTGEGHLESARGKQAIRNQSVVSPEDYAGSSESGG